ncbi:MAG: restriction endonuclease subunit S [Thermoplasmata archaeon]
MTARPPRDWVNCTLGDVLHIKHGYAFKGEFFSDAGPYVLLTPGNFWDKGGFKAKGDKEKYYTGPVPDDYILHAGDLLVAMTEQAEGLLGSSAIIPESGRFLHNQRLGLVTSLDPERIDKRFLYYLFNHRNVRQRIRATCSGVKVRHTSPERIYGVEISLPPILEQRKVAYILSGLDDLIENSLRRAKILEEMARIIYREWFVKFRFPGYEGVNKVDSKLGKIPEGWEIKKVRDVASIHRGLSYRSADLSMEEGLPFLNLKCIDRDGGFRYSGIKRYSGKYKETQTAGPGDIIMAVTDMTQERRVVARAARVPSVGHDIFVFSLDLVRIAPTKEVLTEYLYGVFRFSNFPDVVKQQANGVNVLHLKPDRVGDFEFPLPSAELRRQYSRFCSDAYSQCDLLYRKNMNLHRTHDLLLPRLISGELDVSELDTDTEVLDT